MHKATSPLIIIPARLASARLPQKPLLEINGLPMIVQVWHRAKESGLGRVLVACDGAEIAQQIEAHGGEAVITDPALPSGSDRIWAALQSLPDKEDFDPIINLQGDMPAINPNDIKAVLKPLENPDFDIATLITPLDKNEAEISQIVKVAAEIALGEKTGSALYFSRHIIPSGEGPLWHHVGIYAYRQKALARFVAAKPGVLEQRESLEQLRALALGMRIGASIIEKAPRGVDTPEDLAFMRRYMQSQ